MVGRRRQEDSRAVVTGKTATKTNVNDLSTFFELFSNEGLV
jgi:hypothetical protein